MSRIISYYIDVGMQRCASQQNWLAKRRCGSIASKTIGAGGQHMSGMGPEADVGFPFIAVLFDLLKVGGKDLRGSTLETRKRELAKLLHKVAWPLQLNDHIAEPGNVVFRHACKLGFEGIVSKRLGSFYRSGRSRDWIKIKNPVAPVKSGKARNEQIVSTLPPKVNILRVLMRTRSSACPSPGSRLPSQT